jgi:hypothetical protein
VAKGLSSYLQVQNPRGFMKALGSFFAVHPLPDDN